MVRNLPRRKWLRWCHVLLLHELGAVPDNNVRHRRKLRREPILPRASDTAAASRDREGAPSPPHLRGLSLGGPLPRSSRLSAWLCAAVLPHPAPPAC